MESLWLRGFSGWLGGRVGARLAVAAEHEVAEVGEDAGFEGRKEALGDGDGDLGEDAADFARRHQGAGGVMSSRVRSEGRRRR